MQNKWSITPSEKCPDTKFYLVRIFLYLDWKLTFIELISMFSSNTGKKGPEETPYLDTCHAVLLRFLLPSIKNPS